MIHNNRSTLFQVSSATAERRRSLEFKWRMLLRDSIALQHTIQGHELPLPIEIKHRSLHMLLNGLISNPEIDSALVDTMIAVIESSTDQNSELAVMMKKLQKLYQIQFNFADYTKMKNRLFPSDTSTSSIELHTQVALLWRSLSMMRMSGLPHALRLFYKDLLVAVMQLAPLSLSSYFKSQNYISNTNYEESATSQNSTCSQSVRKFTSLNTTGCGDISFRIDAKLKSLLAIPELKYLANLGKDGDPSILDPLHDPVGLVQKLLDSAESCALSTSPHSRGHILSVCLSLAVKSGRLSLLCQVALLLLCAEGREMIAEESWISLLNEIKLHISQLSSNDNCIMSAVPQMQLSCAVRSALSDRRLQGGMVLSCGKADHGKLGHGDTSFPRLVPTVIEKLSGASIVKIASMSTYSVAIDEYGAVFMWGAGGAADNVRGLKLEVFFPQLLDALPVHVKIVDVSCGLGHALFLADFGGVYSWGNGGNGRLGLGDTHDRTSATLITTFTSMSTTSSTDVVVASIQCGASHSLALSKEGIVYCWGKNTQGQCGLGHNEESILRPTLNRILLAAAAGSVVSTLLIENDKNNIPGVIQVASGWEHSLALTSRGKVYSWGCGYKDSRRGVIPPVLGLGNNEGRSSPELVQYFESESIHVTKIASGWDHCLVLDDTGKVYSWGSGMNGKLGIGTEENASIPTLITNFETLRSKNSESETFVTSAQNIQIVSISAGCEHSAAIDRNGILYTWGHGDGGRLGHGDCLPLAHPTAVLPLQQMNLDARGVYCGDKFTMIIARPSERNAEIADTRTSISELSDGSYSDAWLQKLTNNALVLADPETTRYQVGEMLLTLLVQCIRAISPSVGIWPIPDQPFAIEASPTSFGLLLTLLELNSSKYLEEDHDSNETGKPGSETKDVIESFPNLEDSMDSVTLDTLKCAANHDDKRIISRLTPKSIFHSESVVSESSARELHNLFIPLVTTLSLIEANFTTLNNIAQIQLKQIVFDMNKTVLTELKGESDVSAAIPSLVPDPDSQSCTAGPRFLETLQGSCDSDFGEGSSSSSDSLADKSCSDDEDEHDYLRDQDGVMQQNAEHDASANEAVDAIRQSHPRDHNNSRPPQFEREGVLDFSMQLIENNHILDQSSPGLDDAIHPPTTLPLLAIAQSSQNQSQSHSEQERNQRAQISGDVQQNNVDMYDSNDEILSTEGDRQGSDVDLLEESETSYALDHSLSMSLQQDLSLSVNEELNNGAQGHQFFDTSGIKDIKSELVEEFDRDSDSVCTENSSEIDDHDLQRAILSSMEMPPSGTVDELLFQQRFNNCIDDKHLVLSRLSSRLQALAKKAYLSMKLFEDLLVKHQDIQNLESLQEYKASWVIWQKTLSTLRVGFRVISSPSEFRTLLMDVIRFPREMLFVLPAVLGNLLDCDDNGGWLLIFDSDGILLKDVLHLVEFVSTNYLSNNIIYFETPKNEFENLLDLQNRGIARILTRLLCAFLTQMSTSSASFDNFTAHSMESQHLIATVFAAVTSDIEGLINADGQQKSTKSLRIGSALDTSFTAQILPVVCSVLIGRSTANVNDSTYRTGRSDMLDRNRVETFSFSIPYVFKLLEIVLTNATCSSDSMKLWMDNQLRWCVLLLSVYLQARLVPNKIGQIGKRYSSYLYMVDIDALLEARGEHSSTSASLSTSSSRVASNPAIASSYLNSDGVPTSLLLTTDLNGCHQSLSLFTALSSEAFLSHLIAIDEILGPLSRIFVSGQPQPVSGPPVTLTLNVEPPPLVQRLRHSLFVLLLCSTAENCLAAAWLTALVVANSIHNAATEHFMGESQSQFMIEYVVQNVMWVLSRPLRGESLADILISPSENISHFSSYVKNFACNCWEYNGVGHNGSEVENVYDLLLGRFSSFTSSEFPSLSSLLALLLLPPPALLRLETLTCRAQIEFQYLTEGLNILSRLISTLRPSPKLLTYLQSSISIDFNELWCLDSNFATTSSNLSIVEATSFSFLYQQIDRIKFVIDDLDKIVVNLIADDSASIPAYLSLVQLSHAAVFSFIVVMPCPVGGTDGLGLHRLGRCIPSSVQKALSISVNAIGGDFPNSIVIESALSSTVLLAPLLSQVSGYCKQWPFASSVPNHRPSARLIKNHIPSDILALCAKTTTAFTSLLANRLSIYHRFLLLLSNSRASMVSPNIRGLQTSSPDIVGTVSTPLGDYCIGFWIQIPNGAGPETMHILSRVPETGDYNLARLFNGGHVDTNSNSSKSQVLTPCNPAVTLVFLPYEGVVRPMISVSCTVYEEVSSENMPDIRGTRQRIAKLITVCSEPLQLETWIQCSICVATEWQPLSVLKSDDSECLLQVPEAHSENNIPGWAEYTTLKIYINGTLQEEQMSSGGAAQLHQTLVVGTLPCIGQDRIGSVETGDVYWAPFSSPVIQVDGPLSGFGLIEPPSILVESALEVCGCAATSFDAVSAFLHSHRNSEEATSNSILASLPLILTASVTAIATGNQVLQNAAFQAIIAVIHVLPRAQDTSDSSIPGPSSPSYSPLAAGSASNAAHITKVTTVVKNILRELLGLTHMVLHSGSSTSASTLASSSGGLSPKELWQLRLGLSMVTPVKSFTQADCNYLPNPDDPTLPGNLVPLSASQMRGFVGGSASPVWESLTALSEHLFLLGVAGVISAAIECRVIDGTFFNDTVEHFSLRPIREKFESDGSSDSAPSSPLFSTPALASADTSLLLAAVCGGGWVPVPFVGRNVQIEPRVLAWFDDPFQQEQAAFCSVGTVVHVSEAPARTGLWLRGCEGGFLRCHSKGVLDIAGSSFPFGNSDAMYPRGVNVLLPSTELVTPLDAFPVTPVRALYSTILSFSIPSAIGLIELLHQTVQHSSASFALPLQQPSRKKKRTMSLATSPDTDSPLHSPGTPGPVNSPSNFFGAENHTSHAAPGGLTLVSIMTFLRCLLVQLTLPLSASDKPLMESILHQFLPFIADVASCDPVKSIRVAYSRTTYKGSQIDVLKNLLREGDVAFLENIAVRLWKVVRAKMSTSSITVSKSRGKQRSGSYSEGVSVEAEGVDLENLYARVLGSVSVAHLPPPIGMPLPSHLLQMTPVNGDVQIIDSKIRALSHFPSVKLTGCSILRMTGRWFYECTLLSDGLMQIGWADNHFRCDPVCGQGVGDHIHSWAFDGLRTKKWNVSCEGYGRRWRMGDTVGVLIDTDLMEMRFYLNGKDLGAAFSSFVLMDISPAISLNVRQMIRVNFGQYRFLYPPSAIDGKKFRPVAQAVGHENSGRLKLGKGVVNATSSLLSGATASSGPLTPARHQPSLESFRVSDEPTGGQRLGTASGGRPRSASTRPGSASAPVAACIVQSSENETAPDSVNVTSLAARGAEVQHSSSEFGNTTDQQGIQVETEGRLTTPPSRNERFVLNIPDGGINHGDEEEEDDDEDDEEEEEDEDDEEDGDNQIDLLLSEEQWRNQLESRGRVDEEDSDADAMTGRDEDPSLTDLRRQTLIENLIGMGFPVDWALRAAEHVDLSSSESAAIAWIIERMELEQSKMGDVQGEGSRGAGEDAEAEGDHSFDYLLQRVGGDDGLQITGTALGVGNNADWSEGFSGTSFNQSPVRSDTIAAAIPFSPVGHSSANKGDEADSKMSSQTAAVEKDAMNDGGLDNEQGLENFETRYPPILIGRYVLKRRHDFDKQDVLQQVTDLDVVDVAPVVVSCEFCLCVLYARLIVARSVQFSFDCQEKNISNTREARQSSVSPQIEVSSSIDNSGRSMPSPLSLTFPATPSIVGIVANANNLPSLLRVVFKQTLLIMAPPDRLFPIPSYGLSGGAMFPMAPPLEPFSSHFVLAFREILVALERHYFSSSNAATAVTTAPDIGSLSQFIGRITFLASQYENHIVSTSGKRISSISSSTEELQDLLLRGVGVELDGASPLSSTIPSSPSRKLGGSITAAEAYNSFTALLEDSLSSLDRACSSAYRNRQWMAWSGGGIEEEEDGNGASDRASSSASNDAGNSSVKKKRVESERQSPSRNSLTPNSSATPNSNTLGSAPSPSVINYPAAANSGTAYSTPPINSSTINASNSNEIIDNNPAVSNPLRNIQEKAVSKEPAVLFNHFALRSMLVNALQLSLSCNVAQFTGSTVFKSLISGQTLAALARCAKNSNASLRQIAFDLLALLLETVINLFHAEDVEQSLDNVSLLAPPSPPALSLAADCYVALQSSLVAFQAQLHHKMRSDASNLNYGKGTTESYTSILAQVLTFGKVLERSLGVGCGDEGMMLSDALAAAPNELRLPLSLSMSVFMVNRRCRDDCFLRVTQISPSSISVAWKLPLESSTLWLLSIQAVDRGNQRVVLQNMAHFGSLRLETLESDTCYRIECQSENRNIEKQNEPNCNVAEESVSSLTVCAPTLCVYAATDPLTLFTFSPTSHAAPLVLSHNKTLRNTINKKWSTARAGSALSSGKHRWDVHIDRCVSKNIFIGVMTSGARLDNYVGCDSCGYAFLANKAIWHNKSKLKSYGELFRTGDTISVFLDLDKGTLAFALNGKDLGVAVDGLTGPLYPAFSLYNEDDTITLSPPRHSIYALGGSHSSSADRVIERLLTLQTVQAHLLARTASSLHNSAATSIISGTASAAMLQSELHARIHLWSKGGHIATCNTGADIISVMADEIAVQVFIENSRQIALGLEDKVATLDVQDDGPLIKDGFSGSAGLGGEFVFEGQYGKVFGVGGHRLWVRFGTSASSNSSRILGISAEDLARIIRGSNVALDQITPKDESESNSADVSLSLISTYLQFNPYSVDESAVLIEWLQELGDGVTPVSISAITNQYKFAMSEGRIMSNCLKPSANDSLMILLKKHSLELLLVHTAMLIMFNDILLPLLPLIHFESGTLSPTPKISDAAMMQRVGGLGMQVLLLRTCVFTGTKKRYAAETALAVKPNSVTSEEFKPVLVCLEPELDLVEHIYSLAQEQRTHRVLVQDRRWKLLSGLQASNVGQMLSSFEQCSAAICDGGDSPGSISGLWEGRLRSSGVGEVPLLLRQSSCAPDITNNKRPKNNFFSILPAKDVPSGDLEHILFDHFVSDTVLQTHRLLAYIVSEETVLDVGEVNLILQYFHGVGVIAGFCFRMGNFKIPLRLPEVALQVLCCGSIRSGKNRSVDHLLLESIGCALRQGIISIFPSKAFTLFSESDLRDAFA